MKVKMLVVSAHNTAADGENYKAFKKNNSQERGSSQNNIQNRCLNMDEALAKLRGTLRDLRDQDKSIYRQLMNIDTNIKRLKEEVNIEQTKREEFDDESEDESETESESEIETEEETEIWDNTGTNTINALEAPVRSNANDQQEKLEESFTHERLDSGIIEDENEADDVDSPRNSTLNDSNQSHDKQIITNNNKMMRIILSPIRGILAKHSSIEEDWRLPSPGATSAEDIPTQERSRALQAMRLRDTKLQKFHRRSYSEDQIRVDASLFSKKSTGIDNAAFAATPEMPTKHAHHNNPCSNLGNISECPGANIWTSDDVHQHANSNARKLYRYKIPRHSNLQVINSAHKSEMNSSNKLLNKSLTQLNLRGAISSGTIKAIQRSLSTDNCSVVGYPQLNGSNLRRSLNLNSTERNPLQRQASTGSCYRSAGFQNGSWNFRRTSSTRELDRIGSTISLV